MKSEAINLNSLIKSLVDDRIEEISSSPNSPPISEFSKLKERQKLLEKHIWYLRVQLDRMKPLLEMFERISKDRALTIPCPPPESCERSLDLEFEDLEPITLRSAVIK